uniref:Prokaryotic-type class I peptide chain release factors domain-containing protein n=1 Tax=Amblyomma maculatum TaxID=34609 RepID=G3MQZ4_AMBMU
MVNNMAALQRLGAAIRPMFPAWCRSYKSDISLDKLYPASGDAQPPIEGGITMTDVQVFDNDPSNPYRVEIHVHLDSAQWISAEAKNRLRSECKPYINCEGHLVIGSDKTRKKTVNLADCLDILRCMVREVSRPPPKNIPENRFTLRAKHERLAAARLRVPKASVMESSGSP